MLSNRVDHCNIYYSNQNFAEIKHNTAQSMLNRGTRPDKIIFHSWQMQSCPTTYRQDDTLPPPPFPKTPRQMAVLAISSYFHFCVFTKNIWGARDPASYAYAGPSAPTPHRLSLPLRVCAYSAQSTCSGAWPAGATGYWDYKIMRTAELLANCGPQSMIPKIIGN